MTKTDKIAVYYIATGDYKKLFPYFLKSIPNFYPNNIKIIKIISDGLEEYKVYKKDLDETKFIYLQDKRTYSIKQKQ